MQIYVKKSKLGREKCKMYSLRIKGAPKSIMEFTAQRDKKFKEEPDAKRNKGSGDIVRSRALSANLPACGKELMKSLTIQENH